MDILFLLLNFLRIRFGQKKSWIFKLPTGFIRRLPKGTIVLVGASFLTVVFGYFREATLAYFFGTSREFDAFLVGLVLPQIMAIQATNITVSVVLPVYVSYRHTDNADLASKLVDQWFWFMATLVATLCLLVAIFAGPIIKLIGPGLEIEMKVKAVYWMRLLLPYLCFMAISSCFKVVLDTHRLFTTPALSRTVVSGSVILSCILVGSRIGIAILPIGFVIGSGIAFALQWRSAWHCEPGLPIRLGKEVFISGWTQLPFRGTWMMSITAFTLQINILIDRAFASTLPVGSISALNYASILINVPVTIISTSLSTALFTTFAEMTVQKRGGEAFTMARKWLVFFIIGGMIPVSLLIIFRSEIVSLLLQRGQFDEESVKLVSGVLGFLALMVITSASSTILTKLLLAQKQWGIIAMIGILAMFLKIGFNMVFMKYMGLEGLALATVFVSLISTFLRYYAVHQKYKEVLIEL